MAQVFVSHSQHDKDAVLFLAKAFATTWVRAIFEEYIAVEKGQAPTSASIAENIRHSDAVFVLLGLHVEQLSHTRDWVTWESGFAAGAARAAKKDVWVFESRQERDRISVVIPHFDHYVCFDPEDAEWQAYVTRIIAGYGEIEMAMKSYRRGLDWKERISFEAISASLSFLSYTNNVNLKEMMMRQTMPKGKKVICPRCSRSFIAHLVGIDDIRCPGCNFRGIPKLVENADVKT